QTIGVLWVFLFFLATNQRAGSYISHDPSHQIHQCHFFFPGPAPSAKRTGIPAPRELPSSVAREKAVLRPRKAQPSPTSSGAPTPTKHSRPSLKPKNEAEVGDKAGLASQVKELLAEAKTKDLEITKLRNELKKHQGKELANDPGSAGTLVDSLPPEVESIIQALQEKNKTFQRELLHLREENRLLKEKLNQQEHSPLSDTSGSLPTPTTQESSFGSPTQPSLCSNTTSGSLCVNGPPLRNSGSSSSDVTKASLSPDASDFEHITDVPSRPPSSNSNAFKTSRCSTSGSSPNNASDLSVASLTERIQRMEENHHCTAEELQATLQELSDQQQVVQELTAENEKLAEEKAMLERSFCQHRERAEQLSQENEKLTTLLQDRPKTDESKAKVHELELRCAELQEKAQFEREKMLNIQQQLTSSLRSLEKEHQEAQVAVKNLGEEAKRLGGHLETERTLEDCKVHLEGLKIESESLRSQLDSEKRKSAAMDAMEQAAGRSDAHEVLRGIRVERDQLERSCTELRQELLKAHSEVKTLQGQLAKVRRSAEPPGAAAVYLKKGPSGENRGRSWELLEWWSSTYRCNGFQNFYCYVRNSQNSPASSLQLQLPEAPSHAPESRDRTLGTRLQVTGRHLRTDNQSWKGPYRSSSPTPHPSGKPYTISDR
uniref:Sperm antigen with calponin homology and coiled-coil domains 1 n=1 Tax=Laticauda laticaudata TaxID=8630 RepID=A0A8C5RX50_LATLA